MNNITKKQFWLILVPFILIIIAGFVYAYYKMNITYFHPAWKLVKTVFTDMAEISHKAGFEWSTEEEFLSSEPGTVINQLLQDNATMGNWTLTDFSMDIKRNNNNYNVIISADSKHKWRKNVRATFPAGFENSYIELTEKFLESLTRGSKFWEELRASLYINDFIRNEVKYKGGYKPVVYKTPAEPVDKETLVAYHEWLMRITGTPLRDGWKTPVRLYVDKSPAASKLISASAGPDKKWNTEDDMVFIRDLKTHKITKTNKLPEGIVGTK